VGAVSAGLRSRLAVRAALLAAVALLLVATTVEVAFLRPMEAREDGRLRGEAEAIAARIASGGPRVFPAAAGTPGRGKGDSWAILVGPGGAVLASAGRASPPGAADVGAGGAATLERPAGDRERAVAAAVPGRDLVVVAGASLQEVLLRQAELRAVLAAACLAGVLLVGAGAWFAASLVLDPIGAMTETARRASAERTEVRLPVRGAGDELDRLAALLNDLLARLGGALEDERRFASDAAHELKSPLAVLRLRAEEAAAKGDPEAMARTLRDSVEEYDRVARLVEALLRFSRAPGGGEAGAAPPADAAAVVGALARDVGDLAAARGLSLVLPPAAGPLPTAAPPEVLETCVSVLLDNAFRYTPAGGRVEVRLAGEDGRLRVRVADSGPGVSAEDAGKVFDRLYRGAAGRGSGGGFGLGLALARRLARQAGGEVVLENPGEPGARFRLDLPLAG
jgi:signal transduction histidine kinase